MKRKIVIGLLALGTVAGFGIGIARLAGCRHHHGYGRHGFEQRVADICAQAALRASGDKAGAATRER
jgi:hypothetical protein